MSAPGTVTVREQQQKAKTAMTQARLALLFSAAFYGSLAMRLKFVAREGQQSPMSTDGTHLFYKPSEICTWPQSLVEAGIAHEVTHCACLHPFRQDARDGDLWNQACDYVVNGTLKAAGFAVGERWLVNARFDGQAAETVYATLQREQPPKPPGGGGGGQPKGGAGVAPPQQSVGRPGDDVSRGTSPGQPGQDPGKPQPQNAPPGGQNGRQGAPGQPPATPAWDGTMPGAVEPPQHVQGEDNPLPAPADLEAQWQQAVAAAEAMAKQQGSLPGDLARIVDASRRKRVDWRAEARVWLQELCAADYTWRRPSVKYLARGLYMPRLQDERLGMLVVVRDTSGSIGGDELAQFNAEIEAMAAELKPRRFVVMDCDARVAKVWDMEDGAPLPDLEKAHGGGGTDFRPPFDWVQRQDEGATALIYLTDMMGRFPHDEPDMPVLWVATTERTAPFGKTVPLAG